MSDEEHLQGSGSETEGGSPEETRAPQDATTTDEAAPSAGTPFTQQVGRVVIAILIAIFGALSFANIEPVEIDLIFAIVEVRLFVLIVLTFVAGVVTGLLVGWRRHRRHRRSP